jgi:hypothetical protein
LDHRANAGQTGGAAPELKYGETVIVKTLSDVKKIPSTFDFDQLVQTHRHAFENSSVYVHRFINIVYLIYRFIDPVQQKKNRQKHH